MTLKIYIGFIVLHLALTMGELLALSAAGLPNVGFDTSCASAQQAAEQGTTITIGQEEANTRCIGAIWRFISTIQDVASLGGDKQGIIERVGAVTSGVGGMLSALLGFFTFSDYDTLLSSEFGGFDVARMILRAIGIGVLFLLIWRLAPAMIAATGNAVSGIIGGITRLFSGGA